jgi:hypothetical protein
MVENDIFHIAGFIGVNLIYQIAFTVGLIIFFGLIVGLMNRAFYRLAGNRWGYRIFIWTGFIGTPVHELGHAIFCVIFRHRINRIKLYAPNSTDGTFGYVRHSYNPASIYQQIGNFFIAFGPILFGSFILLSMMYFLVPNLFFSVTNSSDFSRLLHIDIFSTTTLSVIYQTTLEATTAFLVSAEMTNWRWWVFIIPAISIALHMSLSPTDIRGSLVGFVFFLIALVVVNIVLYFLTSAGNLTMTNYSLLSGAFLLNFLTISTIFSLLLFMLGLVVRFIRKLTRN